MARPDLGKKWNYVIDVIMDGCDAPFTAYAQAAFPAALRAAFSYYCPDPVEMFTGYVRPGTPFKGRRKGSHGRGTRSGDKGNKFWRRFKKVFGFDPNEWVAKRMPFAEDMERREVPGGSRYMWAAYGAIERFNNWMFIYQLTENFFYDWMAGVAATTYCQNQRAAVFLGRTERDAHFALLPETPAIIEEVLKQRKVSFSGGNSLRPQVRKYNVGFSVGKITPWIPEADISQVRLIIKIDGREVAAQNLEGDGSNQMAFTFETQSGLIQFFWAGPFSFWADDVNFNVYGYEDIPETQPMDWCGKLADDVINWANRS